MQLLTALVLFAVANGPADLWAQGRSSGASVPGLFGSRTIGTPGGPGRQTFGGLGGAMGMGGSGTSRQMGNLGSGGLLTGTERFIRGNQQGRFVGRDAAEVSDLFRSLSGGNEARAQATGRRTTGGRGNNRRAAGDAALGRQAGAMGTRQQVLPRTEWRAAFAHPQPTPAKLNAALTARIRRNVQFRAEGVPEVELESRTVTLRGVVASSHDRILAEKLALLEPGVSHVRNQLRVAATPPPPAEPPAEPAQP
jgi:hypothetical protein